MDYSPPCSSVYGILQARILGWIAVTSSWPRDWTQVSQIAGRFFTTWAVRESLVLLWSVSWTFMRCCAPTQSVRGKEILWGMDTVMKSCQGSGSVWQAHRDPAITKWLGVCFVFKVPQEYSPLASWLHLLNWKLCLTLSNIWWTTDWNLLWFKYLNLANVFPSMLFWVSVTDEFKIWYLKRMHFNQF